MPKDRTLNAYTKRGKFFCTKSETCYLINKKYSFLNVGAEESKKPNGIAPINYLEVELLSNLTYEKCVALESTRSNERASRIQ